MDRLAAAVRRGMAAGRRVLDLRPGPGLRPQVVRGADAAGDTAAASARAPLPQPVSPSGPAASPRVPVAAAAVDPTAAMGIVLVVLGLAGIAPGPLRAVLVAGPISIFALPWLGAAAEWGLALRRREDGDGDGDEDEGRLLAAARALGVVAIGTLAALLVAGVPHWRAGAAGASGWDWGIPAWPCLMPAGGLAFVAFVQLSGVSEARTSLAGARPLPRLCALGACFAAGKLLSVVLVDWSSLGGCAVPAARWGGGPVPAVELLAWLGCAAAWQVTYGMLGGWPLAGIRGRAPRIAAANLAVLGLATCTWLLFRQGMDLPGPRLAAICAAWVAGAVLARLFGAWCTAATATARRRGDAALLTACLAALLTILLSAIATFESWPGETPAELWLVICGMNLVPVAAFAAEIFPALAARPPAVLGQPSLGTEPAPGLGPTPQSADGLTHLPPDSLLVRLLQDS